MTVDREVMEGTRLRPGPHRSPLGKHASPHTSLVEPFDHADRPRTGAQELDQLETRLVVPRLGPGGGRCREAFERPALDDRAVTRGGGGGTEHEDRIGG